MIWVGLFALVAGTFVTGMTGYITLGSDYPLALLIAVGVNLIIGQFLFRMKGRQRTVTFYKAISTLANGRGGQLLSGFVGMILLIVLLLIATGESRTGAVAIQAISGVNIDLKYFIVTICLLSIVPGLFGFKQAMKFSFSMFFLLILIKSFFGLMVLIQGADLPDWSADNLLKTMNPNHMSGTQGMLYMAIRLAFWSFVGIEAVSIWYKKGISKFKKPRYIVLLIGILILCSAPGIAMAGIFPIELWQLIIHSEEGCFGACSSLAFGEYVAGDVGYYFMGGAAVVSSMGLVSLVYAMMSHLILALSRQKLFFGSFSGAIGKAEGEHQIPLNVLILSFALTVLLSFLDRQASSWVGLALYVGFALVLVFQVICLLNYHYGWIRRMQSNTRPAKMLTLLSLLFMGVLFYTTFRGEHLKYLNTSLAILCFSLWVAASSMVYIAKLSKERL